MLNSCTLSGNLGADPEIHYSPDGQAVATFSLAFNTSKEKTSWIKVVCFQRLAEVCEKYLHKGARVVVLGTLDQERWENNGESRTSYRIIARSIEFVKLGGQGNEEEAEAMLPF